MSETVESITKVGVITDITSESRTSKETGRKFTVHNLFVDGKKYGLGYNDKLVKNAGVKTGDTVKVTIVKKGDYWNVDSLEKTDEKPTVPTTTVSGTTSESPRGNVQQQIVRQTALKAATDVVVAFNAGRKQHLPLTDLMSKVVATADHFVRYIETGKVEVLKDGEKNDAAKVEEAAATEE